MNGTFADDGPEPRPDRGAPRGAGLGLLLIGIGVLALLREFGGLRLDNWWALFILIPSLLSIWSALETFWRDRALTHVVRDRLLGACYPAAVALIFLLGLSWAHFWPVFVILPGLQMISTALPLTEKDRSRGRATNVTLPWLGFTGVGAVALGLGFLGRNLGWFEPAAWPTNWWAVTLLAPAVGGLVSAVLLLISDGQFTGAVLASLAAAAVMAVPAVAALSNWRWDLVLPLGMMAAGIVLLAGYLLHSREAADQPAGREEEV